MSRNRVWIEKAMLGSESVVALQQIVGPTRMLDVGLASTEFVNEQRTEVPATFMIVSFV
jgi:hypothetical protein